MTPFRVVTFGLAVTLAGSPVISASAPIRPSSLINNRSSLAKRTPPSFEYVDKTTSQLLEAGFKGMTDWFRGAGLESFLKDTGNNMGKHQIGWGEWINSFFYFLEEDTIA
ncbi:hypothetical protein FRB93_013194 [Tulasnella sp. JGI-2019a]|nr:hypothetical protein FRB93_013194 [Tulasnella sp. JGI-2019a]